MLEYSMAKPRPHFAPLDRRTPPRRRHNAHRVLHNFFYETQQAVPKHFFAVR